MNREEFTKMAQARSQAMKATAPSIEKEKLRANLESEVAKFLAGGGEIQSLPRGYSAEFSQFNGRPVGDAQKAMRNVMAASVAAAHARRNNPNVIARNKAREEGQRHFHGAECVSCGGTLRYTSTNSCFSCNKASAVRNYKKRAGRAV